MAKPNLANPLEIELALDSAAGNTIANVQNWRTFTPHEISNYENKFRAEYSGIKERTIGCTDVYNCHGLIFASRRTKIYDLAVLRQILSDDCYKIISPANVLAGDIILYIHNTGDISHSGTVLRTDTLIPGNPLVFSKWGPWAEVIHYAYECPYIREPDVTLEYRRRVIL